MLRADNLKKEVIKQEIDRLKFDIQNLNSDRNFLLSLTIPIIIFVMFFGLTASNISDKGLFLIIGIALLALTFFIYNRLKIEIEGKYLLLEEKYEKLL
ncbi:hypothetical protein JW930_00530 [Candidatus Woesearchaeota archaeon]|nr:hypothetical protein [Candidatus Woesearchaeota archaeon]